MSAYAARARRLIRRAPSLERDLEVDALVRDLARADNLDARRRAEMLATIARELVALVRRDATVDWTAVALACQWTCIEDARFDDAGGPLTRRRCRNRSRRPITWSWSCRRRRR